MSALPRRRDLSFHHWLEKNNSADKSSVDTTSEACNHAVNSQRTKPRVGSPASASSSDCKCDDDRKQNSAVKVLGIVCFKIANDDPELQLFEEEGPFVDSGDLIQYAQRCLWPAKHGPFEQKLGAFPYRKALPIQKTLLFVVCPNQREASRQEKLDDPSLVAFLIDELCKSWRPHKMTHLHATCQLHTTLASCCLSLADTDPRKLRFLARQGWLSNRRMSNEWAKFQDVFPAGTILEIIWVEDGIFMMNGQIYLESVSVTEAQYQALRDQIAALF